MPRFRYTAHDARGNHVSGEREAAGPDEVSAWLRSEKMEVVLVEPLPAVPSQSPAEADVGPIVPPPARLSGRDIQQFSGQIASLAATGLPLASGLQALAEDLPDRRKRRGLLWMAAQLAAGNDLATVLTTHGAPTDLCALVEAGVRFGRLESVLQQYAIRAQMSMEVRRGVLLALIYPFVLLGVGLALLTLVLTAIVPQFKSIFAGFGVELPQVTVLLIGVSDFVVNFFLPVLTVVLAVAASLWLVLRIDSVQVVVRSIVCRIPLIGTLLRWSAMARFAHVLALFIENQVPLPTSLVLAGEGSGDAEIRAGCRRLASEVEAGRPLATAAREMHLFPPSFLQALMWERQPDGFADSLRAMGDLFQGRCRSQAALLIFVMEPTTIALVASMAGFIVLALFTPLIKLLNGLAY